jgi:hypothetical protein
MEDYNWTECSTSVQSLTNNVANSSTMSRRKAIICVIAGLVVPLLWTWLESSLITIVPLSPSRLLWRGTQALVGLASAVILALPVALALRPTSPSYGLFFVLAFLASEITLHLLFGGTTESLVMLFQLPDIWVFLVAAGGFFYLVSSYNRRIGRT